MAKAGVLEESPVKPCKVRAKALRSVPLPAQLRKGNVPMPFALQEILDSFVEFDAEAFGLDLPRGDGRHSGVPTAPNLRARSKKSSAA